MKHKRLGDNRGLILPLALMAFVVLGALTAAILSIGGSEAQIASNHLRAIQAEFLAEAGLEHAFNTLRLNTNLVTTANATLQSFQDIPSNTQLGGAGSYAVQYQAAGANTVRVVSTGTSAIGGSQKIRRATISTAFHSNQAILTQGNLAVGGSATTEDLVFQGTCGSVHTNGNLDLSGHAEISGTATATGAYTVTGGSAQVGPGSGGGKPTETVPRIDPADFLNTAKATLPANQVFQMKANGEVRDGSGALLVTLANNNSYCGWTYQSGTTAAWELKSGSNTPCNGTFYFEGQATLSGSPGSTSTPWVTTLIATGNLVVTGSPVTQTSLTDTLFVAGQDVKLTGTPSNGWNGLIAAHEQFYVSGNTTINGFLIAEDAGASSNLVTSDTVNGNLTLNYNCGANPPLIGPLQFLSWGL